MHAVIACISCICTCYGNVEHFTGNSQAAAIDSIAATAAIAPSVVFSGVANHEVRDGVCVVPNGKRTFFNCGAARVLENARGSVLIRHTPGNVG